MKKKFILTVFIAVCTICGFAQDANKAEQLVEEGIKLHDAGKYDEAIGLYYEALAADADHPRALYEMSYTCYIAGKYDSAILIGNKLIGMNVSENILKNVYVTLGSVYDDVKKPGKAEEIYKDGIKKFPDFYLLYFNLGVTYYFENPSKDKPALDNFQKAVTLKPLHAGSNYWQYKMLANENKIPAVLAACVLCIAEQKTKRSAECSAFIQSSLTPNTKSDSTTKNFTIYIPSSLLSQAKENNFSAAELGLSLLAASPEIMDTLHLDDTQKKLSFQLQGLFNFLSDSKKNKGFYWKFYAPFFYDLKQKDYTEVLVNIILMNSEKDSEDWIVKNQTKVNDFYSWVKSFEWPKK